MESARSAHGLPQGKSQRDEGQTWPEANMFPHSGKLLSRECLHGRGVQAGSPHGMELGGHVLLF